MPATVHTSIAPDATAATRAAHEARGASTRSSHLAVLGIACSYQGRRVLSDVSFTVSPGDRLGLIGENGTGKSSLLRILAGVQTPDAGTVTLPGSVGLLDQELPYAGDTPISRVLDDAQRSSLEVLARLEQLSAELASDTVGAADAYASALEEAEQSGAWAAEARRGEMLTGLGLGRIPEHRHIGELSGGQQLRLALAALLLRAPHTLLLDEPSNHLDDASSVYLERVLHDWPGVVIVASHDRALLEAVSTRIIDLDPLPVAASLLPDAADVSGDHARNNSVAVDSTDGAAETDDAGSGLGVRVWGVGYSAARAARLAELSRWRSQYEAELEERRALAHEIEVGSREVNRKTESKSEAKITRKFYADKDARVTARRARNARVRLETLDQQRVRRPPEPLRFSGFTAAAIGVAHSLSAGNAPTNLGAPLPTPSDTSTGGAPVLRTSRIALTGRLQPASLDLPARGRLMLTGPNGSGKSTLLAILAVRLEPDRGELSRDPAVSVGYLPQEASFDDPSLTACETYRRAVGTNVADAVPLTATGLLAPRDADRPVEQLSVGQRRRVALAALVADPPDVLLLDEPTNHLSLTLVEELEEALRSFDGALVIATHDRWLRSQWEGAVLNLDGPGPGLGPGDRCLCSA